MMRHGHRVGTPETIEQARARFERDLATVPHSALDLRSPHAPTIRYSDALLALADEITHRVQRPTHQAPPGP
jgi:hypothetical protein